MTIPDIIADKYKVLDELGHGGMGVVYKVRHALGDYICALKVLHDSYARDQSVVSRFLDEARIMARLSHPNIVKVLDVDKDGGRYYFVMEYVAGRTLGDLLKDRGAFPVAEVLRVSRDIGSALSYAHRQVPSVIHRDIKPSNILIEADSNRVVVTDFGIAKLLDPDRTQHTQTGYVVGTLQYASPEQLRSAKDLDGRSDIFSLGLVMHEMLTGRKYFGDDSAENIIGQKLFDPQGFAAQLGDETPKPIRELVQRAIAKDREKRHREAKELLEEIERAAQRIGQPSRGRRLTGAALAAGTVLLAAAGWWLARPAADVLSWRPADAELRLAEGGSQVFELDGAAGDRLSFRWLLDGRTVGSAVGWQYRPGYDAGGDHVLEVEVSDNGRLIETRQWRITVSDVNRPPRLIAAQPAQSEVLAADGRVDLAVEVSEPDTDSPPLAYFWTLNGDVLKTTGASVSLAGLAAGVHRVEVVARDAAGASVTRHWQVSVPAPARNRAPVITAASPEAAVTSAGDEAVTFSVSASDPDGQTPLRYLWTLNEESLNETTAGLTLAGLGPGEYDIAVSVHDDDGGRATRAWQLTVAEAVAEEGDETTTAVADQPPTLNLTPAADRLTLTACRPQIFTVGGGTAPYRWTLDDTLQDERGERFTFTGTEAGWHTVGVSSAGRPGATHVWRLVVVPLPISETEVNAWVQRYRQAIQNNDAHTLREMGLLDGESSAEFAEQLAGRIDWRVRIGNRRAVAEGDQADLSFDEIGQWVDADTSVLVTENDSRHFTLLRNGCEQIVARRHR